MNERMNERKKYVRIIDIGKKTWFQRGKRKRHTHREGGSGLWKGKKEGKKKKKKKKGKKKNRKTGS